MDGSFSPVIFFKIMVSRRGFLRGLAAGASSTGKKVAKTQAPSEKLKGLVKTGKQYDDTVKEIKAKGSKKATRRGVFEKAKQRVGKTLATNPTLAKTTAKKGVSRGKKALRFAANPLDIKGVALSPYKKRIAKSAPTRLVSKLSNVFTRRQKDTYF